MTLDNNIKYESQVSIVAYTTIYKPHIIISINNSI